MKRILVTGATGNVGSAVIRYLLEQPSGVQIRAAVRQVEQARDSLVEHPEVSFTHYDFEQADTFQSAFLGIDILFLLRPPHLSNVKKYVLPLLKSARKHGIQRVVFLSVQGAEKSRFIPHNRIEQLIRELGFSYIFVRPSYFMQNLTTALRLEIVHQQKITLPSGKARFNWIDVNNIGEAAARLLVDFERHENQAYEITGNENLGFAEVASLLTEILGKPIRYHRINPIRFYLKKRSEGIESGFAVVMTMLHLLPRFQPEPEISDSYQKLTGKSPTTLRAFIEREQGKL